MQNISSTYMHNMQHICKSMKENIICKMYENIWKICKKYAEACSICKICKKYAKNMQNMHFHGTNMQNMHVKLCDGPERGQSIQVAGLLAARDRRGPGPGHGHSVRVHFICKLVLYNKVYNFVKHEKHWRDSIARIVQFFTEFTNIVNIFQDFTLFYENLSRNISCKCFSWYFTIFHMMVFNLLC